MKKCVVEEIDYAIKKIWLEKICKDYNDYYLLKEDTLKNAFYFHLRNDLADLLVENNLRIYTEFDKNSLAGTGFRADIAIVKLLDKENDSLFLADQIKEIVTIIELKYKNKGKGNTNAINEDIKKTRHYIKEIGLTECQFYLGIIQEEEYDISVIRWLDNRQSNNWAKGRVTELNASYYENQESEILEMGFSVISYNELNKSFNFNNKEDIYFAKEIVKL